jgi:hypothetical protein
MVRRRRSEIGELIELGSYLRNASAAPWAQFGIEECTRAMPDLVTIMLIGSVFFYCLDWGVFGGDDDGAGDFYVEFFGVVALVYGDADAAPGVDVEE